MCRHGRTPKSLSAQDYDIRWLQFRICQVRPVLVKPCGSVRRKMVEPRESFCRIKFCELPVKLVCRDFPRRQALGNIGLFISYDSDWVGVLPQTFRSAYLPIV
jgi:hypothetical protein